MNNSDWQKFFELMDKIVNLPNLSWREKKDLVGEKSDNLTDGVAWEEFRSLMETRCEAPGGTMRTFAILVQNASNSNQKLEAEFREIRRQQERELRELDRVRHEMDAATEAALTGNQPRGVPGAVPQTEQRRIDVLDREAQVRRFGDEQDRRGDGQRSALQVSLP